MIAILIALLGIPLGILLGMASEYVEEKLEGFFIALCLITFIPAFLLTIGIIVGSFVSYNTALDLEAEYAVFKTGVYHEAFRLIEEEGELVISIPNKSWTDLADAKYIEVYASAVRTLKEEVRSYNSSLLSKQKYNESLFYNWVVTMPENVKPVRLTEMP